MKIGILTYPLNNNYGCYLQSYALRHFLKQKGYDAEYIYRRHDKPSVYFYLRYALGTLVRNIKSQKWNSLFFDFEYDYMMKKGKLLYPFFAEYICTNNKPIYTTRGLQKACEKYDVIIVGSDQVWRAEILSNIEDYFLSFIKDEKIVRIAYAASFGKDNPGYTEKQRIDCGKALEKFNAVSVREASGRDIILRYGWDVKEVDVVLDPTMLLKSDDYSLLIKSKPEDKSVFGYILDQMPEKKEMLKKASDYLGVASRNILENVKDTDFMYPPVEDWLGYVQHAEFILTDSFHGAVFSIIFNKPFAVVINKERGASRFNTLLNTFGLMDRIVNDRCDLVSIIKKEVDWTRVNSILQTKREEAESFLINGISGKRR